MVDGVGQAEPGFDAEEIGVGFFSPGGHGIPGGCVGFREMEDELLAFFLVGERDFRGERLDLEAVDEGGIIQVQEFRGGRFMHDGAVGCLASPRLAGEMQRPVAAFRVWDGEVKVMARVVGQGIGAGVRRLETDFQARAGLERHHHVELKRKRKVALGLVTIGEAHPHRVAGFLHHREFRIAHEAVLRHGTDDASLIAPKLVPAIDEMPCDEGKEEGIAAAHLEDVRPVGIVRPADDLAALLLPRQDARAMLGGDDEEIIPGLDFVRSLVLEQDGAFHVRVESMPVDTLPHESKLEPDAATIAAAYAECTRLARAHYENFPVGQLVPREMQPHVHAVYAFARHADDLADEGYAGSAKAQGARDIMTPEERLAALDEWERQLRASRGTPDLHVIFIALHETIRKLDLPLSLFTDLLSAFKQDVVKSRYANFPEVLDYCRRSANPVGRLVLLLHGVRDEKLHVLADHICTGLQLANFWQDVGVDLEKNRMYLPEDDRVTYGVTEESLFAHRADERYRSLLKFQVGRTQEIFDQGKPLTKALHGKLRLEIRVTWLGGTTILRKIEALDYDTLNQRPKLGKAEMALLFARALVS